VECLLTLLDHQNSDITVESVALLKELTDEELLLEHPETQKTLSILVENEVWNMLTRIICKLDLQSESEHLNKSLSLLENMLDA